MSHRKTADQMVLEHTRVRGWRVVIERASETNYRDFSNEPAARRAYRDACNEVREGEALACNLECDSSTLDSFDDTDC